MSDSIITETTNTPTPAPEQQPTEQQPDASAQVEVVKKSTNAARRNKYTGSLVSLSNAEGQWVAFCETHNFTSEPVKTRNDAEVLRVAGTFCPECSTILASKQQPTAEQQPEPTPEPAPTKPKKERPAKGAPQASAEQQTSTETERKSKKGAK